MRAHLAAQELPKAREAWRTLEKSGLLAHLGPPQLHSIATALLGCVPKGDTDLGSSLSVGTTDTSDTWTPADAAAAEDIALFLATARFPDPLIHCMLRHLRLGAYNDVLVLYARYERSAAENELWTEESDGDADEVVAEVDEPDVDTRSTTHFNGLASIGTDSTTPSRYAAPGAADLRLVVYAAYAQMGDSVAALRAHLAHPLRISYITTRAERFAAMHLGYSASNSGSHSIGGKLIALSRRLEIAHLVSHSISLTRRISYLGRSHRTIRVLTKLYDDIMAELSPNGWLVPIQGQENDTRPLPTPAEMWSSFVHAFALSSQPERVARVWDDMHKHGIPRGARVWAALIGAYGASGDVGAVRGAWAAMIEEGVKPDAVAYTALLPILFNEAATQPAVIVEALGLFNNFRNSGPDPTSSDTVAVYNTVLHGLLTRSRPQEARALFDEMRTKGPKPDVVSYNTFLRFHARSRDLRSLGATLSLLSEDGIAPDAFTFSTILSAMLKAGRRDAPALVASVMERNGVRANVATYTTIIDAQVREGDEENVRGAFELLESMERDPRKEVRPNEVTYTTLLTGVARGGFLSPVLVQEYVDRILARMRARDVHPNRTTYHVLMASSLRDPSPGGLERALGYYREMRKRKMAFTMDTWQILLRGVTRRGQWAAANELVDALETDGFEAHGSLLELIARIRREGQVIRF